MVNTFLRLLLSALISLPVCSAGLAETYPGRPIRFLVPLSPGSGADTNTRFIADKLTPLLGQSGVVENRMGGNSIIATQGLLAANADGYTVLTISPASMIQAPILQKAGYDPLKDLRFVGGISMSAALVVTGPRTPYDSLQKLLAKAKASPATVTMGSYSNSYREGVIRIEEAAGVQFSSIQYKGATELIPDLIEGRIDAAFISASAAQKLVQAGSLRALGISSEHRSIVPALAKVPTLREAGLRGADFDMWLAFAVRSGTPAPAYEKLKTSIDQVIRSADYRKFLAGNAGEEPYLISEAEFNAFLRGETERFKQISSRFR